MGMLKYLEMLLSSGCVACALVFNYVALHLEEDEEKKNRDFFKLENVTKGLFTAHKLN